MNKLITALRTVVAAKKIYHGSPSKFKKFETSGQGKNYGIGIYFTEDLTEAKDYAVSSDEDGYVYEVKLNASNSYDPNDPKHARQIADHFNLDWAEVAANELWKNPSTGYSAEDKDNYYIKLADVLNERAKAEGRRWWEGEKDLTDFIHQKWDSIHDTRKGWWVVRKPSAVKILKSTKVLATAALKSVVAAKKIHGSAS